MDGLPEVPNECGALRLQTKNVAAKPLPRKRHVLPGPWEAAIFRRCGLRDRHIASLADTKVADAWTKAYQSMIQAINQRLTVVIIGPRGTGKTQLATNAAVSMIRHRFSLNAVVPDVRAFSSPDFMRTIRLAMKQGDENAVVRRMKNLALLTIDDLHELDGTNFEQRTLFEVLDYRYAERLPSILIANQDEGQFAESVGASLASRIAEAGVLIEATWQSFRIKG